MLVFDDDLIGAEESNERFGTKHTASLFSRLKRCLVDGIAASVEAVLLLAA